MALPIIQIGHPVLHEVATDVPLADIKGSEVQTFIDELIETKRDANGAGIAAPQVANSWRIYVVEIADNPRYPYKPEHPLTVMVNPQITFESEDRYHSYEGCLSIPNIRGVVERCPKIRVEGFDRDGSAVDFRISGITAGTFQHEQDHLDGVLFTDRLVDTKTLCTWDEFSQRHEADFRKTVEKIEAVYNNGSE